MPPNGRQTKAHVEYDVPQAKRRIPAALMPDHTDLRKDIRNMCPERNCSHQRLSVTQGPHDANTCISTHNTQTACQRYSQARILTANNIAPAMSKRRQRSTQACAGQTAEMKLQLTDTPPYDSRCVSTQAIQALPMSAEEANNIPGVFVPLNMNAA
jgi:hypothetical protein